jgi:hypothetical protein
MGTSMIDDRLNSWLAFMPEAEEILLCNPHQKIIKSLEKIDIKFKVAEKFQDLKVFNKFEVVCLWMEDIDEDWIFYTSHVLKLNGTLILFPVKRHKKEMMASLNKLGLRINEKYIILPHQGNPRWLIPEAPSVIMSKALDIYHPYLFLGKIVKIIIYIFLKFNITKNLIGRNQIWIISRGQKDSTKNIKHLISDYFKEKNIFFSLASGTLSIYRKVVIQVINHNAKILGYLKVGLTKLAKIQIERELQALEEIEPLNLESIRLPEVLKVWSTNHGKLMLLSATENNFQVGPTRMDNIHFAFLNELYQKTVRYYYLEEHPAWLRLNKKFNKIDWNKMRYNKEIIYKMLSKIRETLKEEKIPAIMIHGDWAPWNTLKKGNNLFVFDWEYSERAGIPFYDIVYWNFQVMVLLKKKSSFRIFQELERTTQGNYKFKVSDDLRKAYYLWSLCEILNQRLSETNSNNEYLKILFDTCVIIQKI